VKLRKRGGIDMTLADIDAGIDAVFLPGKIHSCEWQVYIIYLNESANDGNGSFEIEIIDAKRILDLYVNVKGNTSLFFEMLPDWFQSEWYYCDNGMDGFDDYVDAFPNANFIVGQDGDETDEMMFLVSWAIEAIKKM